MRDYIIMTDSCCDLSQQEVEELDLTVLPLSFTIEGKTLLNTPDHADMSPEEFFAKIAAGADCTTAAVNVGQFTDAMEKVLQEGKDILCVCFSSALSTTYQSACIAKEQFPEAVIQVVDTRQVTFGLALLVRQAAALRDAGHTGSEIAEQISRLAARVRLYAVIDDLKYLRLGGRLSSAGAVLGTLLGIKPIISVQDGQVVCVHKMRGQKAGCAYVLERAGQEGIDPALPVCFGHSHLPGAAEELRDMAGSLLDGCGQIHCCSIGPVVGTHAGPGCAGFAFFVKE